MDTATALEVGRGRTAGRRRVTVTGDASLAPVVQQMFRFPSASRSDGQPRASRCAIRRSSGAIEYGLPTITITWVAPAST